MRREKVVMLRAEGCETCVYRAVYRIQTVHPGTVLIPTFNA